MGAAALVIWQVMFITRSGEILAMLFLSVCPKIRFHFHFLALLSFTAFKVSLIANHLRAAA